MNGFFNILKPPGMTSAAVVGFLRRITGEKRIGHAGTLDPDAAGVLPVMIGRAARLFDYLVEKEKTYLAECAFGTSTDTQDASGQAVETGGVYPGLDAVMAAAASMEGEIIQCPSVYSAIKRDGKPLYAYARAGEAVEVPERRVMIHSIRILREMPRDGVLMEVRCGRGTYIRSICHDLGEKTGCPAHMRFLLRTSTGVFRIEDALTLEEVQARQEAGTLADALMAMDAPLLHLPALHVPRAYEHQADNGAVIPWTAMTGALSAADRLAAEKGPCRIYVSGRFCGMGQRVGDDLRWRMTIPPAFRQGGQMERGEGT